MIKSKERFLYARERELNELKKKLHPKEIGLADQLDQNNYSKAYITTMDNKMKEQENTIRLLKMKMPSESVLGQCEPGICM